MSGATQGVKFKPFFAVESEDQMPSGSVDSPPYQYAPPKPSQIHQGLGWWCFFKSSILIS